MTRKRRRHSPEQIIRKLAEGNKLIAGGMTVEEVARQFGIAGRRGIDGWPSTGA